MSVLHALHIAQKAAKRGTTEDRKPPGTKEPEGDPVNPSEKHKDVERTLKAVGAGAEKPKPDISATRPSPAVVTTTESLAKKEGKKDGKKLPQCPYGTACYRWDTLISKIS